ncbi:MAG TPA: CYTH domain-containing protein, partial [Marinobacter hydrocarbonoclasticus]|nr:CYTH domain-containing protein [Marinobacter nauticus]
ALRVRQAGDRYIQTLKTQGEFVNGAHRRQEWEWDLPGPDLDL